MASATALLVMESPAVGQEGEGCSEAMSSPP